PRGQLRKLLRQGISVSRVEIRQPPEEGVRVDPGRMAVAPAELERIVPYLVDGAQLRVAGVHEPDPARVALAAGARAVPAEDSVRKAKGPAVAPESLHGACAMGRLHSGEGQVGL